jgi:uncharacterized membrane protein (DUF485 family)
LVLGKLLEQDDHKMGYDAAKGLFVYFGFPLLYSFFQTFLAHFILHPWSFCAEFVYKI